jgi:hypothetical protein
MGGGGADGNRWLTGVECFSIGDGTTKWAIGAESRAITDLVNFILLRLMIYQISLYQATFLYVLTRLRFVTAIVFMQPPTTLSPS